MHELAGEDGAEGSASLHGAPARAGAVRTRYAPVHRIHRHARIHPENLATEYQGCVTVLLGGDQGYRHRLLWLEAGRQAVHVGDGDGERGVALTAQR